MIFLGDIAEQKETPQVSVTRQPIYLLIANVLVQTGFPPARRCHSCVSHKKGTRNCSPELITNLFSDVFISGGYNGRDVFDDIWHLNLDLMQWMCLSAKIPKPTYFHAAALTPVCDRYCVLSLTN